MLQVPTPAALMFPVQVSPLASSTVIVTVLGLGFVLNGGAPATALATVKLTVTACSCCDGSGVSAVIVVVVLFFAELKVHAEKPVTPESSAQLFAVSPAP